jgi:hypothetical protein
MTNAAVLALIVLRPSSLPSARRELANAMLQFVFHSMTIGQTFLGSPNHRPKALIQSDQGRNLV